MRDLEWRAEVPVEACVDDGVEEAVSEAEPEQRGAQPGRHAARRLAAERLDERRDEEGQPAGREGAHDDPEGLSRLAVVRGSDAVQLRSAEELELVRFLLLVFVLLLVLQTAGRGEAGGEFAGGDHQMIGVLLKIRRKCRFIERLSADTDPQVFMQIHGAF